MRRATRIVLVAWGFSLLVAALALAQPPSGIVRPTTEPGAASTRLGGQLFAANCASCHGPTGQGISSPRPGAGDIVGAGPSLRGVGAQAADFYLRTGYMPLANIRDQPTSERVLFDGKEIRSIVSFVASLGSGPGIPHPSPSRGSLSQGLALFTEHCAGCHQVVGRGGFVTGALVPPLQGVPATQIAEAVRIGPYLMPRFSTSQISDSQLNSIVRYVRSTAAPDNRGGWGIGNLGPIPEGLIAWWIGVPLLILACRVLGRRRRHE